MAQLLVSGEHSTRPQAPRTPGSTFTLFSDLDLPAPELRLLDVLHTEIAAAFGVGLLFLAGGHLVIRAVGVGGS